MHRFYLPNLQQPALAAEEAHHCIHVLRLKAGDTVNVFDGRGHEAQAQIAEITKDSVRLTILQQSSTSSLPCQITLAQAIPKKSMDLIVQKATELGVATIVPLMSERTLVQVDEDSKKIDRWREIALDACKQCGNNWLPEIQPPQKARDFLNAPGKFDLKLIASLQPDAKPLRKILAAEDCGSTLPGARVSGSRPEGRSYNTVLILIGPEGDFTPAELSLAKSAGCLPLSLGPLVLRADTAALYTLSILHHELQNPVIRRGRASVAPVLMRHATTARGALQIYDSRLPPVRIRRGLAGHTLRRAFTEGVRQPRDPADTLAHLVRALVCAFRCGGATAGKQQSQRGHC